MSITLKEKEKEKAFLKEIIKEIKSQLDSLGKEIHIKNEQINEFKKFLWEEKASVDKVEMQTSLMASEMEANFMLMKMEYYKKLFKIENSPYFGRIDFKENDEVNKIYIGITHLSKDLENLIYDWRSPIASMFYDYGIGKAKYEALDGEISGEILLRRQYNIENKKLIRIFDNDLNVVDECLQDVLSEKSSEKMKNIVNTIQEEQNKVIRNIRDKNLIVQGIAGSGKTSVALHRIAFLLYKIKNLKSSNVLIFSPNNVFSEYISNVLPELGEENALETTFHDFAKVYIKEFKNVESFTDFIGKYYKNNENNEKLTRFKLSNRMIDVIEKYASKLENNIKIVNDLDAKFEVIDKDYLNYLLKDRFSKLPLYQRIDKIAEHICNKLGVKYKEKRGFIKQINDSFNIKKDYKKFYSNLFLSDEFINVYGNSEIVKLSNKEISYPDALCFIYLKGLLEGFPYNGLIKQVVIDEAQDYNEMQYIILSKIFKRASFTVLGDVNQTINPYQKYESMKVLTNILNDNSRYLELNKTYRSSSEIIEYTNKILNLKHVSAMRRRNNTPVIFRDNDKLLLDDIKNMKRKYSSVAIITKDDSEAANLYNELKEELPDITLMNSNSIFNKDFVIIPSYLSKGLEFDSVISYSKKPYNETEKNLYYVVLTRAQHELIIYSKVTF